MRGSYKQFLLIGIFVLGLIAVTSIGLFTYGILNLQNKDALTAIGLSTMFAVFLFIAAGMDASFSFAFIAIGHGKEQLSQKKDEKLIAMGTHKVIIDCYFALCGIAIFFFGVATYIVHFKR